MDDERLEWRINSAMRRDRHWRR